MNRVDLHVHSTRSDGTFSPEKLVDYAMEKGLSAFALTDHDSIDGLAEAISYADSLRERSEKPVPRVIPGIEFSSEYHGRDVHIVGLFIDWQSPALTAPLQEFVDSRRNRNHKMCELLREHGIDITFEALQETFPESVITRAHYAKYLLSHGYVRSMSEAFDRYVGDHAPCYIPREKVTPAQAVKLILDAKGIPVLAHPILYHLSDRRLEALVAELKEAGLMAIEAIYSTYSPAEERQIRALADKYRLLVSGGSDFHGANKPGLDLGTGYGNLFVPESVLTDLENALHRRLLFTDLDGTLLHSDSRISENMKKALARMTSSGHGLILSSGRPLPSIREVVRENGMDFPNLYIIANNGALVYDCAAEKSLLECRISQEDIRLLVQEAEKSGLHIHGYTDDRIVCHRMNEELAFYTRRIHLPLLCTEDIADALPGGSFKLQIISLTDRGRLEAFREKMKPLVGDRIQMIFSNDTYLEALPKSAGKGAAVRFLTGYLCCSAANTYAAGDAENDISMLQTAACGIAMKNAAPTVQNAADVVTGRTNEEDGLLAIIEREFR